MSHPVEAGSTRIDQAERPSNVRYLVLLALAFAAINAYLVRVCISPAASTIQKELSFSDPAMGDILGGFFVGYIWTQIPGGWLGDRLGARVSLALISLLWSAFTFWTSWTDTEAMMRWSRIAVGLAEGGLFPIMAKVITDWFPLHRRGIASAVPTGCMSAGSVLAQGLTAMLLPLMNWRTVFQAYSVVGVVWAILFYVWFRNRPEEHPAVNQAEVRLIRGRPDPPDDPNLRDQAKDAEAASPDLAGPAASPLDTTIALVTSLPLWAHCGQSFFRAFGYAFFITWFPSYLERSHHVAYKNAGLLAMLPMIAVVVGSPLGGVLVDAILTRTGSKWLSRSGLSAISLFLCALATYAGAFCGTALTAVLVLSLGQVFFSLTGPTTWAATMDIGGRRTALIFAIMNIAGNVGAIACPKMLGHLLDHINKTAGDWNQVLYLLAGIYLAGGVCWLLLNPNRSAVERTKRPSARPVFEDNP